jgi:hypothetical protein
MTKQSVSRILMIRPVNFHYNDQTAKNNYYQKVLDDLTPQKAQENAQKEFDEFVQILIEKGVQVLVVEDTYSKDTPDSIFPNNWVTFHEDGRIGLYPMFAENRRAERREEIFEFVRSEWDLDLREIVDFTEFEDHDKFLEGTGSMVLDRENKIAYAALSLRTDEQSLFHFCEEFDYQPISFTANQSVDGERMPIYHTNVMMCIASKFAVICEECIDDEEERKKVLDTIKATGKEIISITEKQKNRFAGNMLEVLNDEGDPFLVMSSSAYSSLTPEQVEAIEKYCPILHSSLDTIEALGGGSARCMMAEVFLPRI